MKAGLAAILLALVACTDRTTDGREWPVEAGAARLSGAWQVSLRLERPMSFASVTGVPKVVQGRLSLLVDHSSRLDYDGIREPTHVGVFDVNLDALACSRGAMRSPKRWRACSRRRTSGWRATLSLLCSTRTSFETEVWLAGTFDGDSIVGTWRAGPLVGGGWFVMRRWLVQMN